MAPPNSAMVALSIFVYPATAKTLLSLLFLSVCQTFLHEKLSRIAYSLLDNTYFSNSLTDIDPVFEGKLGYKTDIIEDDINNTYYDDIASAVWLLTDNKHLLKYY